MAVLIDLTPFFPRPVVIQGPDGEHRLDARHLTTELVLEIDLAQRAVQDVRNAPEDQQDDLADEAADAFRRMQDRIRALLMDHATPPLDVSQLPPTVLGALIGGLHAAAMGGLEDDGEPDPPARAPRRGPTTSSSKSGRRGTGAAGS